MLWMECDKQASTSKKVQAGFKILAIELLMGSRGLLPHHATGIDLGDFAVEFRPNKFILFRLEVGDHFTLHSGDHSGIIDVHRTWTDDEGNTHHETLFAIHRERIVYVLKRFKTEIPKLESVLRHLRIGWLSRQRIGVLCNALPIEDGHIARVTRRKTRKRLQIDPFLHQEQLFVPEYLDDILDLPDGSIFFLTRRQALFGIGIKARQPNGALWLRWVRVPEFGRVMEKVGETLVTILKEHGIPPERYKDHDVLQSR